MALISMRGIHRIFGNENNQVHVLKDINLTIERGEFVAIMGQSGSGKTTLMNLLGCLDTPTSGSYQIDGKETVAMTKDALATLRRLHFGFVFQRYQLIGSLSALDNVSLPAVYAGMNDAPRQSRAQSLLERLGLGDKSHQRPAELSGGQQQRVSIARAMMNGGEVIFADEPTGALDSASGRNVLAILKELHQEGHTIIMVTHDASIAAHAKRIIEIADGKIIRDEGITATNTAADSPVHRLQVPPNNKGNNSLKNRLQEAFRMSLQSIFSHKLRSFLTMLGIIIGIAAVVLVVALGRGSQEKILQDISGIGTNTISIFPGSGFGDRRAWRIRTMTAADAEVLAAQNYIDSATPGTSTGGLLTASGEEMHARIEGVGEEFFQVRGIQLDQGRFFQRQDINEARSVVVIDHNAKKTLFKDFQGDVIGQVIRFNRRALTVIGVTEPDKSPFAGDSGNLQLYVPYTTVMGKISGDRFIRSITVRIKDGVNPQVAEQGITELLKKRHGRQDFFTINSDSVMKTVENTIATMTLLISMIAVISLVVGGIGVMNIMLVSVTERTQEIGIRMAVGARQSDIRQQFLIESMLICFIGGLCGIGLALFFGFALEQISKDVPLLFSSGSMIVAFVCSTAIGLIFGFLPARNAAKLDPVVALSRE